MRLFGFEITRVKKQLKVQEEKIPTFKDAEEVPKRDIDFVNGRYVLWSIPTIQKEDVNLNPLRGWRN